MSKIQTEQRDSLLIQCSRSMGLNLATVLAPEGVTVNIVSLQDDGGEGCVLMAEIPGSTGHDWGHGHDSHAKINVSLSVCYGVMCSLLKHRSSWTSKTNMDELWQSDAGLAIAASVPVHRLGTPEEVANIVSM